MTRPSCQLLVLAATVAVAACSSSDDPNQPAIDAGAHDAPASAAPDARTFDAGLGAPAATGSLRWAKAPEPGFTEAYATDFDAEGNVLVLFGSGGATLAKYDPSGNLVWSKSYAAGWPGGLVVDRATGNAILALQFKGTLAANGGVLQSAGGYDIAVVEVDAAGHDVAAQRFGGPGDEGVSAIARSPDSTRALAGFITRPVDLGGGTLPFAGGSWDALLLVLDGSLNHVASKSFGSPDPDRAFGVAIDASDNVTLTGQFNGSVDFGGGARSAGGTASGFVASTTRAGAHRWSHALGAGSAWQVVSDEMGNVYLTGSASGTVDLGGGGRNAGYAAAYAVALDASGAWRWDVVGQSASEAHGYAVAVDRWGEVVLAGNFFDSIDFGGGHTLQHVSEAHDVFVAKLDARGGWLWGKAYGGSIDNHAYGVACASTGDVSIAGDFLGTSATVDTTTLTSSSMGENGFVAVLQP